MTARTVLLQAIVDRCRLDTFDLWTRYEALPRLRRRELLGDLTAVARSSGSVPAVAPSAISVVDGRDGYRATVWIRPLESSSFASSSSVVTLVLDDARSLEAAARDLARFVEFALVETMEWALAGGAGSAAWTSGPESTRSTVPTSSVCDHPVEGIDSVSPPTVAPLSGSTSGGHDTTPANAG